MVDWNHNGERDAFDFAMDMMVIEEMERASSNKKSTYNNSYKSSSSASENLWETVGCMLYLCFIIIPTATVFILWFAGEHDLAIGLVVFGVILHCALYYVWLKGGISQILANRKKEDEPDG